MALALVFSCLVLQCSSHPSGRSARLKITLPLHIMLRSCLHKLLAKKSLANMSVKKEEGDRPTAVVPFLPRLETPKVTWLYKTFLRSTRCAHSATPIYGREFGACLKLFWELFWGGGL